MRWTKKQVRIQKIKWFLDGFITSWLVIFFMMGFFWIATGSGQDQLKEPVVAAGILGDQSVQWSSSEFSHKEEATGVFLQVMGARVEVSLSQLNNALQVYKQINVLVPPKYRLAIDFLAWLGNIAI